MIAGLLDARAGGRGGIARSGKADGGHEGEDWGAEALHGGGNLQQGGI